MLIANLTTPNQLMTHFLTYFFSPTLGEILLILFFSLLSFYLSRKILDYLLNKRQISVGFAAFLQSVGKPLQGIILVIAFVGIGETLFTDPFLSEKLEGFDFFSKEKLALIRKISLIIFIATVFLRWKKRLTQLFIDKQVFQEHIREIDEALFVAISKLLGVVVGILSSLMVLDALGIPIQALIAFGGIGTFAVSLAGKDVVANFFGGLVIYINRPFSVGNWISSPNKNFEGVVEEIGWYMTRVRTLTRRPMYIPNALITDAIIENPGRMYNRRIKTNIGVRYKDFNKLEDIIKEMQEMIQSHPEVDHRLMQSVNFVEYGPSSLNLNIYCFTKSTKFLDFRKAQQDIFLKIGNIIDKHGAEIAFPTQTLHVETEEPQEFVPETPTQPPTR